MKKLIFIIFILFSFASFSQISIELLKNNFPISDGKVVYQEVVNVTIPINASEIYKKARLWMVDTFYSSKDVLQVEDKENATLIAKGFFNIAHNDGVIGKDWFTLKIEAKDGKYRYTIYDIRYEWSVVKFTANDPIESWIPGSGQIKLKEKDFEKSGFRDMINNFYITLNKEFNNTIESLKKEIDNNTSNW